MVKLNNNSIKIFQSISAARFGRSPASSTSSNDTHSNAQWLPTAEEYRIDIFFFIRF
jgi:hypothetical protein